jgi:bifunctional DNA-binding transcriptional regulator/antitoxin component of YhaV-PrlF toxin-antitoxin module
MAKRPKIERRATILDQGGRFFVPLDVRKAMGLPNGGTVEWFTNEDGLAAFCKAPPKKSVK